MTKRILYVEDSKDTAKAVEIILKNAGYDVELAYSGKEGVQKAKDNFDLYLLDVMLPDMSGWDIFGKIKDQKNATFAFLSAIPVSNDRLKELHEEGVSDYITKPFKGPELVKRVKAMIGE